MSNASHTVERVLVVGASSDIGKALVGELLSEKIMLGCHYFKNGDGLKQMFQRKNTNQAECKLFFGDLRHQKSCHRLIDRFVQWSGGIDALVQLTGNVNNRVSWQDISENDWSKDIEVNLTGPFFLAQKTMAYMRKDRAGRIIFTSTASASHGGGPESIAYGVAKAGIECLTKGLARCGAEDGIVVNTLAPGFISTKFHEKIMGRSPEDIRKRVRQVPLKRAGTPIEVASFIKYLLQSDSGYITGQTVAVSGGDWL